VVLADYLTPGVENFKSGGRDSRRGMRDRARAKAL